jgi:hypothetical protein
LELKSKPVSMTKEEYAALPAEITVRELRYRVKSPGFRAGGVTVVTTLLEVAGPERCGRPATPSLRLGPSQEASVGPHRVGCGRRQPGW